MAPLRAVLLACFALVLNAAPALAADPDTVQVFFSRSPDSLSDFTAVFPVNRDVPAGALLEGALAALIAGPTPTEQATGLFSDLRTMIVGPSTCKGQDFLLMSVGGVVTLQLCHQTQSAGIGQDARAQNEINATAMQFPGTSRVIVLGATGHCLFDESGLDLCLGP